MCNVSEVIEHMTRATEAQKQSGNGKPKVWEGKEDSDPSGPYVSQQRFWTFFLYPIKLLMSFR